MVEKNPTISELIKVIEHCTSGNGCDGCIARYTTLCDDWVEKVINLIHQQQAVKDTAKEIWNDITSHYFALRVLGNATVELDKLAEFWHKHGVEVE